MAMEIQLINQIEKYEFLYNYHLPEYNRKDLVEDAWATIASTMNLSTSDCKEKWRNIRSSFLRSMRASGSKVKKPYYLTEYLNFIIPFLKPITVENTEENQNHYETQPSSGNGDPLVVIDFIKTEPAEFNEKDANNDNQADNAILSDLLTRQPPAARKRRHFVPLGRRNMGDVTKRGKVTSTFQTDASNTNSAMKMFLLSLLPELDSMTEDQTRMFKIKSMMLIDDIKQNYPQMRQNTSSANTERLQKRLINLLLKNLERNV